MGQMIKTDIDEVSVGSLIFIADPKNGKKRPHVCVSVFRNERGVPYNWMLVPLTSAESVGIGNLVEVKHPKLKLRSYAKINNLTCIRPDASVEVARKRINYDYLLKIAVRIKELILT